MTLPGGAWIGASMVGSGAAIVNGEDKKIQIIYGTSYGSDNSYGPAPSSTESFMVSGEGYFDADITYNHKNMNGGATESFSYVSATADIEYGGDGRIVITKTIYRENNQLTDALKTYGAYVGYQAFTLTPIGGAYDTITDYYNGDISGYEAVGYGATALAFGGVGVKVAKGGFRILNSGKYSKSVYSKMNQDRFHNFSSGMDGYMKYGKQSWPKQRDGVNRLKIELPGNMRGKNNWYDGHFEWIINPDSTIVHRTFIPN